MFDRNLRSEIETLKDELLGKDAAEKAVKKNVIAFITDLQNRIHTANQLAKQHSEQEQKKPANNTTKTPSQKSFNQRIFALF